MVENVGLRDVRNIRARSLLFAPGDDSRKAGKLLGADADLRVLDWEDAVAPVDAAKAAARRTTAEVLDAAAVAGDVLVRVNAQNTKWHRADVRAVQRLRVTGVVLPKAEDAEELDNLRELLTAADIEARPLIVAGIETARGVHQADEIASAADVVYFGAEDFVTDVGGRRTVAGLEVLYARSRIALSARLHHALAVDQAVVDVRAHHRFLDEARGAADLGYAGKICLHPDQAQWAHEAFTPSANEVATALRIVGAYADAVSQGQGVVVVDGQMVDRPIARNAEAVLIAAGHPDGSDAGRRRRGTDDE